MIQNVIEDGAAANEDIKAGDIILKVDGKDVNKPNELQSYVATKRAGNEVELELYRDGNEISRSVKLKSRDGEKEDSKKVVDAKTEKKKDNEITTESFDNLGLTVQDISKNDAKQLKVDDGILVKDVKRFSKAANQRLMQGLVIVEVDKKPIHSVEDFKEIIESKAGDAVLLKVIYPADGNTAFIGLEIPED